MPNPSAVHRRRRTAEVQGPRQAPAHRRAGLRPLLHEPVSVQCEVCSHTGADRKRARRTVQSCPHRNQRRRAERSDSHNHLRAVLQRRIPDQRTDERQEIHQAHIQIIKKKPPQLSRQFLFVLSVAVPEGSTRTCALYGVVPVSVVAAIEKPHLIWYNWIN